MPTQFNILSWVGSKSWHVPAVRQLWRGERLVELFCGSCAVSLGLASGRPAVCNDANPHLINFWRHVQQGFEFDIELGVSESLYYEHRAWFNELIREGHADTPIAAQLFYYLNRVGFNSLCRFNRSDEFNVPYGGGKTLGYNRQEWKDRVARFKFTSGDFRMVRLGVGDFVYADPPYDSTFGSYVQARWTREDTEELLVMLRGHPGPVMIMNAATEWVLDLLKRLRYRVTIITAMRQRMHHSQDGNAIPEVMATKED